MLKPTMAGHRRRRRWALMPAALLILAVVFLPARAQNTAVEGSQGLTVGTMLMCEGVQEFAPMNPAVVFSVDFGQVACFTTFDSVPEKTIIYHNWYRRDVLNTKVRLLVKPPRWRTFSKIQLRASDKGPWRVEVTDADGAVLGVIRFSIVD